MKKILLIISCMFIVTQAAAAQETEKWRDKEIEELSKKFFLYSTTDGKESLVLTTQPDDDWYGRAFSDSCDNTIVNLTRPEAALAMPNSSLILAFLQCPASRDFQYDSIVAFFDRKNLDAPLCFSRLSLMPDRGPYYYGTIQSLEARKVKKNEFYVVVKLSGGDAGDNWESFTFLHIDRHCKITLLTKLYSSYHCNGGCEGTKTKYRFLNNSSIEITERDFTSEGDGPERIVKITRTKYDLSKLYGNPEIRTFPAETEKAAALLNSGLDVNERDKDGATPLFRVAQEGSARVVKSLIEKGAQVNARDKTGNTPLVPAIVAGETEVARILLDNGADVAIKDRHNNTPLMWAAREGRAEIVRLLLDKGADVSAKNDDGETALICGVTNGRVEAVKSLLNWGVEIEQKDKNNRTPLILAAEQGRLWMVRLLVEHGAEVNATMENGWRALTYAADNGHDIVVKYLLQRGASVNATTETGWTALIYAAKEGYREVVKALLSAGADVNIKDNSGRTALMIASENGHTQIVELLKAHGAKE